MSNSIILSIQVACFTFYLFFPHNGYPQEVLPIAQVTQTGKITLPENEPLSTQYTIQFDRLTLSTKEQIDEFFKLLTDGAVRFSIDYDNKSCLMILNEEYTLGGISEWSIQQWNEYFIQKEQFITQIKAN